MSLDPAALPLLLAGPILRRVEADLVCVWVATSRSCSISLLLFEGADLPASENEHDDLRAGWVSALQSTLQIGAHLHVLAVTLDLRSPGGNASRSAGSLKANESYSYDLQLFSGGGPPQTLRTLGLLADPFPLGYDRGELPGFRTAPVHRDQLVIVHGSCRLMFAAPPLGDDPADDGPFPPPGGWPTDAPTPSSPLPTASVPFPVEDYPTTPKIDGLHWVDALLDRRGPVPHIADRPHQLFLTGDQIYADDISAVLMPVLNHVGRVLVGDEQLGIDAAGVTFADATLDHFPPAFRRYIVRCSAGFTTSDGESHLLSFGEFAAYYLLTWSPALWTLDLWPSDFDPSTLRAPADWLEVFLHGETNEPTTENSAEYEHLLRWIEDHPEANAGTTPEEHAAFYFEQRRLWITSKYWSPELFEWWTRRFREGLPRVRRALANVSTYMLADDHEVTDDWYFSRQWREAIFTRPLGVDIIRHGLMAYSLMQAWGNDPRRWAAGAELELRDEIGRWMGKSSEDRRNGSPRIHELLGLPFVPAVPGTVPTFRPLVEYSYQAEGPCHRVFAIDGRTKRRFPTRMSQAGGIDYEGATGLIGDSHPTGLPGEDATGLFGDSPMAAALPESPVGDDKLTLVVTGVPVLGPEGMELALLPFQRLARLLLNVDAEAWSYEPATYEALLAALARYKSVILLSGDIHLAFTAVADYWSAPAGQPISTARIVQLVSSGITQDWGSKTPVLKANVLSHDILESVTNTAHPSERVGWGSPLKMSLAPPVPLGDMVLVPPGGALPHPSYRFRLKKMRAPVVPTHGWPDGSKEERDPNWAWRTVQVRDERLESTSPPTIERRWTPVEMPLDPIAPSAVGWHARAVRRLAYGRVFAFQPNIGVVTFESEGDDWFVRHVIAGELPPMPETGNTPDGLQPYIVHRVKLTPLSPETWDSQRPRIVGDGGWGADKTEPALPLLLHSLPIIWRAATAFPAAAWNDLPPVVDDITREVLISEAADSLSVTFRRRVLRELGPHAGKPDAEIDAITDAQIEELLNRVGKLDVSKEARALVRPDLERLLAFQQSLADPAAFLDDVLLLACSEWVNERNRAVSLIAGLLATFRSPVTRQAPVLKGLLEGLWDLWRKHTHAEHWNKGAAPAWLAGLLSLPPRAVEFLAKLIFVEGVVDIIQNHDPRNKAGRKPIFPPELALAGLGGFLSYSGRKNKRLTFVSGWEPRQTPVDPGLRLPEATPDSLARQTLSMMVHPGDSARYKAPAQRLSITLIPPPPTPDTDVPGDLFAAWDGGLQFDHDVGEGVRQRIETDGNGWIKQPWKAGWIASSPTGVPGAKTTLSFLRPTTFEHADGGIVVRFTPSIGIAIGHTSDAAGLHPTFELRLSLNDSEDRVSFVPDTDGFLRQLLPTDGITLPLDATMAWDPSRGWRFGGIGELARPVDEDPIAPEEEEDEPRDPGLDFDEPPAPSERTTEVTTPVKKRLGPISVDERKLEVIFGTDSDGATIAIAVTGTVSLNLGPVRIAVSGLGVKGSLHLASVFNNLDEMFSVTFDPAMPTGLAVSLTTGVISGGGFLQRIESSGGAVSWRGGLAFRLGERFDVAAWGVIESGGGRHWSLLAFLFVNFFPPVPLTIGLKLVAVGGLVALHRSMNTNALRDAATGTQGNLDALLLPDRPEQRFLELLPSVERFFPPAPHHHVFGFMVEIEWKADTGTRFGYFRAVLLGEVGDFKLGLYGTAQFGFPTLTNDKIARIRASIEALYDHEAKLLRFTLTLTEALLFKSISLTGGAALLIRWGDHDEFAFTLGGFHPSFRPFIPEGLREPARLGMQWKPHSMVDLSIQLYVAFTSTSFQFGFSANLKAGASWGGIRGYGEFDFLIMKEPDWHFEFDLALRVTAFLFGCDLISAGLRGSITGPGPWVFEGAIYWEVCGVDLSKDIGPYDWGEPGSLSTTQQEVRQILGDAFQDATSWSLRRTARLPVRLRPGSDGAFDPRDQLDVRQTRLPLATHLEVNDGNGLSDGGAWTLTPITSGLAKVSDLTDVFPTRRYQKKPPKETPFQGNLPCGVRFGGTGWDARRELAVASDEDATEDLVLDSLPTPPKKVRVPVRVRFDDAVLASSPTQSTDRKWTRHAVMLETVVVP